MKKYLLVAIMLPLLTINTFANDNVTLSQLSTLAARQRGATLRLLKSFIYIKGGSNVVQNKRDIERNVAFMDVSIDLLQKRAPNPSIKANTDILLNVWQRYRKMMLDDNNNDIQATIMQSDNTFKAADDVVTGYIAYAAESADANPDKASKIIKTMAQCCALRGQAEKISIYYAMLQFKLAPNVKHTDVILKSVEEISNGFSNLMLSELTTTDIYTELSKLLVEWKPFYDNCKEANGDNLASKKIGLIYVYNTMNTFFENIDKLVSAYGNLLKD
jgi:hypothetical protein